MIDPNLPVSAFRVPLSPEPQTFTISLAAVTYQMTVHWCAPSNCWVLDLADANSVPIIGGIPLVTGCDLLGQFDYLGIGGGLFVQTSNDTLAVPTLENLGTQGNLYFVTQ